LFSNKIHDMPKTPEQIQKDKDDLTTFRFQDLFDKRYAQKSEVVLLRTIIFSAIGLILSSVIVGIIGADIHFNSDPIPSSQNP
jgi:hypothetical protein